MFGDIIGQSGVVSALERELRGGAFPVATLLSGPSYSGKLSTALEIARVLTCRDAGAEACTCDECIAHRGLVHPYTILLGTRYFNAEIGASAVLVLREPTPSSALVFTRAVRKLIRRFDSIIWEGDAQRIRGADTLVIEVDAELQQLEPGSQLLARTDELEQTLNRIKERCSKLSSFLRTENIPINHIRNVESWLHLSSPASGKIVILENADAMLDSSRNALLKLLEEPPPNVYIVLIGRRKEAILPTIRSRVREYGFAEREYPVQQEVLSRIFHERPGSYRSLREFFLERESIHPDTLRAAAIAFLTQVASSDGAESGEIVAAVETILVRGAGEKSKDGRAKTEKDDTPLKDLTRALLEELLRLFGEILRSDQSGFASSRIMLRRLDRWTQLVTSTAGLLSGFRMSPGNILQYLVERMRDL